MKLYQHKVEFKMRKLGLLVPRFFTRNFPGGTIPSRRLLRLLGMAGLFCMGSGVTQADSYTESDLTFASTEPLATDVVDSMGPHLALSLPKKNMGAVKIGKEYVLGINRFDLDGHTEILGWQLSDRFYLGRQDGLDSGLTLVFQQNANQVSLSKDGLRLTRRF